METKNGKVDISSILGNSKITFKQLHWNVWCDECGNEICGFRYKCLDCPNLDLCSSCEMKQVHSKHTMLRIVKPSVDRQNIKSMHTFWTAINKAARLSKKHAKKHSRNIQESSIKVELPTYLYSKMGSPRSSSNELEMKKMMDYRYSIVESLKPTSPCSSSHNLAFIASKNRIQSDQSKPKKIISKIVNPKRDATMNNKVESNPSEIKYSEKRQHQIPNTQFKSNEPTKDLNCINGVVRKYVDSSSIAVSSSVQSSEKVQTIPSKSKSAKAKIVPRVDECSASIADLSSADSNDRTNYLDRYFKGIFQNLDLKYDIRSPNESSERNSSSILKIEKSDSAINHQDKSLKLFNRSCIEDDVIRGSSSVAVSSPDIVSSLVPVSSSVQSFEKDQKLPLQSTSIQTKTIPFVDHVIPKTNPEKLDGELQSETPTEQENRRNPRIIRAVRYMTAMGFCNDNDWLTCLLETVDGDILEAQKILNPIGVF